MKTGGFLPRVLVTAGTLFLLAVGGPPAEAAAAGPGIADLLAGAEQFDGTEVRITGEVVGDVMLRGAYGWINVSDGTGVIGVWAPAGELRGLWGGRYGLRGDVVEVTGTFRRADPRQGGEMDVEGRTVTRLEPARPLPRPIDRRRLYTAGLLGAAGAALGAIWWRRERGARLRRVAPA